MECYDNSIVWMSQIQYVTREESTERILGLLSYGDRWTNPRFEYLRVGLMLHFL